MEPLRGLSTVSVTAWAEMLEMMGRCTHACSPKQQLAAFFDQLKAKYAQLSMITFEEVPISKLVTRMRR